MAPNIVIGVLIAPVSIGDTVFNVSGTVFPNLNVGHYLSITDGVSEEEYGFVLSKDSPNSQVTVQNAATIPFAAGSFVRLSIPRLIDLRMMSTSSMIIGLRSVGSAFAQANTQVEVRYTNDNGIPKELPITMDLLY